MRWMCKYKSIGQKTIRENAGRNETGTQKPYVSY